jgi:hypothetical protein
LRLNILEGDEPCIEIGRRVCVGTDTVAWSPSRREQFLLRPDVQQPLSIDHLVWPAVGASEGGALVAFSILLRDVRDAYVRIWRPRVLHVEDNVKLLGYDVADEVMTSGLSNCGYSDEEKRRLRPTWGPYVNQFHLFDDAEVASQFKLTTEFRVPEHAPFFVFGIYLFSP